MAKSQRITSSIIIPVHNEELYLEQQLNEIYTILGDLKSSTFEVILIENGSKDNTWKVINKLKHKFPSLKAFQLSFASYGQALKTGILNAQGEYLFLFNLDFFDKGFFDKSLILLESIDFVIASKTLSVSQDKRSRLRRLTTYFFNVFLRLILNYPGTDTHGIKAFRKTPLLIEAIHRCRTQHELFDTELVIRMNHKGAIFTELPITVQEVRPSRYTLFRRLKTTSEDLGVAFYSKYIIRFFPLSPVVADDYGISAKVNKAIIDEIKVGRVQTVAVLANMVKKDAIKKLKEFPQIKISLHLNLIEGRPVTSTSQIPSLVDSNNCFFPLPLFVLRLWIGLIKAEHIRLEIENQIKTLQAMGIKISHLDSHQHIHFFAPIWNETQPLLKKYKIKHMRSFNSTKHYLLRKPHKLVIFWFIHRSLRFRYSVIPSQAQPIDEYITHPGTHYDRFLLG